MLKYRGFFLPDFVLQFCNYCTKHYVLKTYYMNYLSVVFIYCIVSFPFRPCKFLLIFMFICIILNFIYILLFVHDLLFLSYDYLQFNVSIVIIDLWLIT